MKSMSAGAELNRDGFIHWGFYVSSSQNKYIRSLVSILSGNSSVYQPCMDICFPDLKVAFEYNSIPHLEDAHTLARKYETDIDDKHRWVSSAIKNYIRYLEYTMKNNGITSYPKGEFLSEVYMDASDTLKLERLLRRKRNIILQGAPGTGKTYTARRLCYLMMGERDDSRIEFVQFNQNTSYDDFVYGYRPTAKGSFEAHEGTFTSLCKVAKDDPDHRDYFLIIDEINRANISKVLGELLMLIESDKRGTEITISASGKQFCVPSNLYIIGTMNSADRGLALIDYALRRRFAFFELKPAFAHPAFLERVASYEDAKIAKLAASTAKLNEAIAGDKPPLALGSGFQIGHSYFCLDDVQEGDAESILEYELLPLISEYWFDSKDAVRKAEKILKDAFDESGIQ